VSDQAGVRVLGADQAASSLRRVVARLQRMQASHAAIGTELVNLAGARVPNRSGRSTGALRRSIRADAQPLAVIVTATAGHAGAIEYGVGPRAGLRGPHNIAPGRYMAGARDRAAGVAVDRLTTDVDAIVSTVKGA
jgi:hypothetical protein